jgi:hypothetical protein
MSASTPLALIGSGRNFHKFAPLAGGISSECRISPAVGAGTAHAQAPTGCGALPAR